ncbi:N-acetylneuraminate synthase family protein [Marinobacteraceae bacterium S3BR75-40.1]
MTQVPQPPKSLFVAEVSSNHHQDLQRCLEFVDEAAHMGCDAVKFQLFKIDQLFAPEILAKSKEHRRRKDWELPLAFLPEIAQRCRQRGVLFSCTPFYLEAVEELEPYVDFYKIASYELLWDDLLRACAAKGKPLVLSIGMAQWEEIDHAVKVIREAGCSDLTLLHCVSAYPTPPAQCNLAVIGRLRERYGCRVGWSDHTVSPAVLHRAVHRWGAEMIEFHLDLEGRGDEYSAGHCWLPDPMAAVIDQVKTGLIADGNPEKTVASDEAPDRDWRADPEDGLRPLKSLRRDF